MYLMCNFGERLSNGHSPQICQNGKLLVRMCRGESHFSQKWRMSNVSECIESGEMVGECRANVSRQGKWLANVGRMYRVRPKQVGKCRRKQDRSFYEQITYFICIKRSSLHSLNLPNSPNSLNSLNSCKSRQICLSRMYRVRGKWLANVGRMYRVQAK
jgi:hypothetical protein